MMRLITNILKRFKKNPMLGFKPESPDSQVVYIGIGKVRDGFFQLRENHFSDPYPQVSCPRKLGHKNLRVWVRKVNFPGWKKLSLLFQSLNGRK
jgi:hypothetical protein